MTKTRQSYPFGSMAQMDFFFLPYTGDKVVDDRMVNAARAAAHQYGRRHGCKYKTYTVTHRGEMGLKVLRVE